MRKERTVLGVRLQLLFWPQRKWINCFSSLVIQNQKILFKYFIKKGLWYSKLIIAFQILEVQSTVFPNKK